MLVMVSRTRLKSQRSIIWASQQLFTVINERRGNKFVLSQNWQKHGAQHIETLGEKRFNKLSIICSPPARQLKRLRQGNYSIIEPNFHPLLIITWNRFSLLFNTYIAKGDAGGRDDTENRSSSPVSKKYKNQLVQKPRARKKNRGWMWRIVKNKREKQWKKSHKTFDPKSYYFHQIKQASRVVGKKIRPQTHTEKLKMTVEVEGSGKNLSSVKNAMTKA